MAYEIDSQAPIDISISQPMTSCILGGYIASLSTSTTPRYNHLWGSATWSVNELKRREIIPADGTLRALHVKLTSSPGGTFTFRLIIDGVEVTGMDVVISGTSNSGSSPSGFAVQVYAGQTISLKCTASGVVGSNIYARWAALYTGTRNNESILMGGCGFDTGNEIPTPTTANLYNSIGGGQQTYTTENYDRVLIIPCNGILKNLYLSIENPPGAADNNVTVTLMKGSPGGSTSATAMVLTMSGSQNEAIDTAHQISVLPGDRVTLRFTTTMGATAWPTHRAMQWGVVFEAETNGDFILAGNATVSGTATPGIYYTNLNPWTTSWTQPEANNLLPVISSPQQPLTIKAFYLRITAVMAAGENYIYTLRRNNASETGLSIAVTGPHPAGYQENVANLVTCNDFDDICLQQNVVAVNTQNSGAFGILAHITP